MISNLRIFRLRTLFSVFALVMLASIAFPAFSQSINQQNFSNIRVDELTDDQIRQFLAQVEASGLSQAQLEQVALARGMSATEIQKLKIRVDQLKKSNQTKPGKQNANGINGNSNAKNRVGRTYTGEPNNPDSLRLRQDTLSLAEQTLRLLKSKIFGAELFKNSSTTFEPNLRLATPKNYQIGPDDELLVDIYGYSEASYQLTVSPEGSINIPYVGIVQVGGMTIEQATARIKSRLSQIYSGLKTGNTSVNIAIGNIRSIKVILTGEIVKPGTYTLPSVATVFNALYASGGPTENGSFRQIEIIRAGRKIATLDVYDFLLHGDLKNNVRLQDQDVIRVPTYRTRVEVVGEVKRPGIYEMLSDEKLADLIRFTGGFTERAYRARIKVLKNTETERRIADISSSEFNTYIPTPGDKFFVNEILDRFENRVTIEGAVFRPGEFELEPGLTVSQLIRKAEGLREDAFQNRAYITRLGEDLQTKLISFDVAKVLSGKAPDITLQREDVITISSIFDLKEEYTVRVEGEVLQPGILDFAAGMNLEDAIIQVGGLKESATPKRVEVSRRVKNSDALSLSAQTAQVFQIDITNNLKDASGFILQPFDIVIVRPSSGYEVQRQVRVEGEVLFPGLYTISKKDERISDLVKRAGGFTALAYPEGASLKRGADFDSSSKDTNGINYLKIKQLQVENERLRLSQLNGSGTQQIKGKIISGIDSLDLNRFNAIQNDFVGINLPKILKSPSGKDDIFLEEGDVLNIPKQLQTVKVSGEVLSPSTVVFLKNKGFKEYISNAGGFSQKSLKRRSYIIYANGSVRSTRKFLFFNNYPLVKPGSEILVPRKDEKSNLTVQQLVGITTGLASLTAIIVSLLR
ncbi:SLBB domain-containing protein [Rubrolithibacter danxiaensis]|uniref:SLBB domain-containing protein n=1 Tax=Rubrolithibacter danxiaensis TaxID=3390805 RepID=UPI003BF8666C